MTLSPVFDLARPDARGRGRGAALALGLAAVIASGVTSGQSVHTPVVLLSVDGLKPDYVLEADRHGLSVPNFQRFLVDGAYATGVMGVAPTVTYPSHTTLVTGVSPAVHGILNNTPYDPLGHNGGGWYWYAQDIRVPSLWDAAEDAGLTTASVDWPVTVGARIDHNIVQYWRAPSAQPPGSLEDHKLLRALSTPGLLDEAERELGVYPAGYQYTLKDDDARARFAAWMLEQKRPHVLTAYFSSLDEEQHHTAPYSRTTLETLEGLDALVGRVRTAAERTYGRRFVMAVVSDHGHITTDREVHLNAALQQAGLIDIDTRGRPIAGRAFAWSAGGSAAIVVSDTRPEGQPARDELKQRVRTLLRTLAADAANGIARIVEGPELERMGGFPTASFVVDLRPGFRTGGAYTGPVTRPAAVPGGTHGYLPGHQDMDASFFIVGDGVPAGRNLGRIDMRDIAPTLAVRLGVSLPRAEGRNRL